MRDILEKIEQEEMCGNQITQEYAGRLLEPIRRKFPRHEIVGFPLHLPMTPIQNILDAVKSVELHKTINVSCFRSINNLINFLASGGIRCGRFCPPISCRCPLAMGLPGVGILVTIGNATFQEKRTKG